MRRLRICRPCRSGCSGPALPRRIPVRMCGLKICNSFIDKVLQENQLHALEIAAMCRIVRRAWQRSPCLSARAAGSALRYFEGEKSRWRQREGASGNRPPPKARAAEAGATEVEGSDYPLTR